MQCTTLLIFTLITFCEAQSNLMLHLNNSSEEFQWLNYVTIILQRYENFDIVFHCYNSYTSEINILSKNLNSIYTKEYDVISIMNYEINKKFERPHVSQVVHVIYDFDKELTNYLAVPTKIKPNDVIIFLSKNVNIRDKMVDIGEEFIKIGGKTLLIQSNNNKIEIFKVCYYCGDKSNIFYLLQSTENMEFKIKNSSLLPSKFSNLNQHLFYFSFMPYFPICYCVKNITRNRTKIAHLSNNECTDIRGIEGNLLHVLSEHLNFTYKIFCMDPDAGWFNMIDLVHENKIDFAISGISMTAERIPLVQFTQIYNFENMNFLYLFDLTFNDILYNFMSPFRPGFIWGLYFSFFAVLSFVLYLSLKFKVGQVNSTITMGNSFWALLQITIEQSNPYINSFYHKRISCGLILTCCWCCSLIFCTMYKSTVLSATAYPPNQEPEDMADLLNAGYKLTSNQQFRDLIQQVMDGQGGIYKKASRQIIFAEGTCSSFNKMLTGHIAMLDEQSSIQYEVRQTCDKPLDEQIEKLRMCKRAIRATGHAWAIKKSAPYVYTIDRLISRIITAGFFKKWNKEVIHGLEKNQIRFAREINTSGVKPLSLKRFLPIILIYGVGIAISITVFFLELICWHYKFSIIKFL